tara:strand:- start:1952 stop:2422 length:471 start_codon:yes stop_codon:yes gene_type:complete
MQSKDQQSAKESYADLASNDSKSFLIDVRSSEEWFDTGVADFSSMPERLVLCEWRQRPLMDVNENFFKDLTKKLDFHNIEKLYFICAAGVRSQEALVHTKAKLKDLGFNIQCVNIFDGFNGNTTTVFGFGRISGWKASGLPYCQVEQTQMKIKSED